MQNYLKRIFLKTYRLQYTSLKIRFILKVNFYHIGYKTLSNRKIANKLEYIIKIDLNLFNYCIAFVEIRSFRRLRILGRRIIKIKLHQCHKSQLIIALYTVWKKMDKNNNLEIISDYKTNFLNSKKTLFNQQNEKTKHKSRTYKYLNINK